MEGYHYDRIIMDDPHEATVLRDVRPMMYIDIGKARRSFNTLRSLLPFFRIVVTSKGLWQ